MVARTRVKICGITRAEDARLAVEQGADALGFVFVEASRRYIAPDAARLIAETLPPFITRTGLFLDASASDVEAALALMPDLLPQFHGCESAHWCEQFDRPYLKAIGVGEGMPAASALAAYRHAAGFLFDSNAPGELGGTGHTFDWTLLDRALGKPLVLAGGLDARNVGEAISTIGPWAVDVSSGVEAAPGIKDPQAVGAFMRAVRQADADRNPSRSMTEPANIE